MGWIRGRGSTTTLEANGTIKAKEVENGSVEHIESLSLKQDYPVVPLSTSDAELPFIPPSEVKARRSKADGGLWIVIDNIVYDCTEFLREHPGGEAVIKSFAGAECSWQFWRFHGKLELEEYGKPLRIGRTEGIVNRYKEPIKYVGMKCRSLDDW